MGKLFAVMLQRGCLPLETVGRQPVYLSFNFRLEVQEIGKEACADGKHLMTGVYSRRVGVFLVVVKRDAIAIEPAPI